MARHSAEFETNSDQYISYSPTSFVEDYPQIGANSEDGQIRTSKPLVEEDIQVISSDEDIPASISATSELVGFSWDSMLSGQSISPTSVSGKKRPSSGASNAEVKKSKVSTNSNRAIVPEKHGSDGVLSEALILETPTLKHAAEFEGCDNNNIVEVSSNSTSNTLRQERNARQKNWQTMTPPRHPHVKQLASRSETSSDLPNSSQSNDDVPNKYGIRPTLLKGTAPGESLEPELTLLAKETPQMTLNDKICFWQCPSELSDVEDVNSFDDLFRQQEEAKRKARNDTSLSVLADVPKEKPMDFETFCEKLKNTPIQALQHPLIERPTTSAAARAAMTKMHGPRLLPASMDKSELSPLKQSQNSTSPPASSSSENSVKRYTNVKKRLQKVQPNETTIRQSSTEETSTDENDKRRHHMMLTEKRNSFAKRAAPAGFQRMAGTAAIRSQSETKTSLSDSKADIEVCKAGEPAPLAFRNVELNPQVLAKSRSIGQYSAAHLIPVTPSRSEMTLTPYTSKRTMNNSHSSKLVSNSSADVPSIFRTCRSSRSKQDEDPKCLIQARLDSTSQQKQQQLKEKKSELFKTPLLPSKNCQTTNGNDGKFGDDDCSASEVPSTSSTGGFHQQHEFCNYLGLTNMLTANAVANAVAELSKCSVKRRSLRVYHQRQQERRDKSAKAASDVQLQAAKEPTDHKNVQQPKALKSKQPDVRCDDKSLVAEKELEERVVKPSAAAAHEESELPEQEADIKIVFQINADSHATKDHVAKEYTREIMQDCVREVLKAYPIHNISSEAENEAQMKADIIKREPLCRAVKQAYDGPASTTRSKQNRSRSHRSFNSEEKWSMGKTEQEKTLEKDEEHPETLRERQRKFQQFLEESRQHKPAIFIVKSMHSQDELVLPFPKADIVPSPVENNAVIATSPKDSPKMKPLTRASTKSPDKNRSTPTIAREKMVASPARRNNHAKTAKNPQKLKRPLSNIDLTHRQLRAERQKPLENGAPMNRSLRTRLQRLRVTRSDLIHYPSVPKGKKRRAKIVVYKQYVRTQPNSKTNIQQPVVEGDTKTAELAKRELPLSNGPTAAPAQLESVNQIEVIPQIPKVTDHSSDCERLKRNGSDTTLREKPDTKDVTTQCGIVSSVRCLWQPQHTSWKLPLKTVHGAVVYMFYELDVLIVVQEQWISFWKYSKLINILAVTREPKNANAELNASMEWILLGECKRKVQDVEVTCPYNNRMCQNNSLPVYLEMRCFVVPGARRECNLLHLYMNIYYYNEEDMQVKAHSVHLDTVQTTSNNVTYTTLPESRYFVMSWLQENAVGKVCNGMCKYSLTPALDTLASIREFKNLRHEIRSLDCVQDDKLIGFGNTQLTIWDHRSGDVIMNYDLEAPIGRSLGNLYFPSADLGQNNMLVLFQYQRKSLTEPELVVIACSISCSSPSYRILQSLPLPAPAFSFIASSINTSEHLIITAQNDEELWISCATPNLITSVPALNTRRFYARGRTQLLEMSKESHNEGIDTYHLAVDSISNYLLKLATKEFLPLSSPE